MVQVKPPLVLPDNATLLSFLDALFQHSLPESLRIYTIFYLALRMTLFTVVAVMIVILLKRRKFWLFRMVKVPKGSIICPNACEALLAFAGIFYICDAIYRALSVRWYWDKSSYQTNILLFTGVRLFPLWIAGFVHVIALAFLGPVSPAQLNPHLYHLFLFGAPLALMVSTLPTLILGNKASNDANLLYQAIRVELAAKPGSDRPDLSDLVTLKEIGVLMQKSFNHFRNWAYTGAVFNILLMSMHAVIGTILVMRIYSALRRLQRQSKYADSEQESYVVVQHQQTESATQEDKGHSAHLSLATTCVDNDRDSLEEPTEKSRRVVLFEFLIFTAVQSFCLVSIGATMLAAIVYLTNRLVSDLKYSHDLPLYRQKLIEVGYTYQVIEMCSVLVFGTPLIIMVLYRHCFPVKVELKKKVKRQWHNVEASEHPSLASSGPNADFSITLDTSQPITALPSQAEWQSASPISPSEQKSLPFQVNQTPRRDVSDRTLQKQSSQDIARDACAYAGLGAGRSIVLDALENANNYPRRRRRTSPWDTPLSPSGTFTDWGASGGHTSTQLFATPHGVVEGMPLSPITAPEESLARR